MGSTVDVLHVGYLLPFYFTLPHSDCPLLHFSYDPGSQKHLVLQEKVKMMMEKGAVEHPSQGSTAESSRFQRAAVIGGQS